MDELQFKQLIDRYLANTASAEDLEQLDKLEQSFITTQHATALADVEKQETIKARIYQNIYSKINSKKHFGWFGLAAAVAASIYFVCVPQVKRLNSIKSNGLTYTQVVTSKGEIKKVHLSDGSLVTLNAGSTLFYPARFQGNTREVKLVGQAFFKVQHNHNKPFVVHAGALTTKVLGTTFDVYAYPEAKNVRITLATGRIQIANQKADLAILKPNQQLVYNKAKTSAQTLMVNSVDYTAWKTGLQLFKQSKLDEVSIYLNKWYGLTTSFQDQSLKNYKITTLFTTNMPVRQVLDVVAASCCAQYTLHNHKVVLSGNGCHINTSIINP
jgi:transmembrane sensor